MAARDAIIGVPSGVGKKSNECLSKMAELGFSAVVRVSPEVSAPVRVPLLGSGVPSFRPVVPSFWCSGVLAFCCAVAVPFWSTVHLPFLMNDPPATVISSDSTGFIPKLPDNRKKACRLSETSFDDWVGTRSRRTDDVAARLQFTEEMRQCGSWSSSRRTRTAKPA